MTVSGQVSSEKDKILLSEIIAHLDSLPAAPGVVGQVLALTAEPDFAMDRLVRLVRMDPAITAHVLKMCNSPYYGLRHKVASLDHAIAVLGVNALVDVVLSSGLLRVFGDRPHQGYLLKRGQLWRHSVACGLIAQKLSDRFKDFNSSIIFTAALLHDVGKLVLNQFVNQSFYEIESLIVEQRYSLVEAEKEVLGIDHASLGGIVVEKWAFPEEIISAISYHHQPMSATGSKTIVMLTALSNLLALAVEYGVEIAEENCDSSMAEIIDELKIPQTPQALLRQSIDWISRAKDLFRVLM